MAVHWCFTVNNYRREDIKNLLESEHLDYVIIGEETAPETGTPHLQGYLKFPKGKGRKLEQMKSLSKKWFDQDVHWEKVIFSLFFNQN